MATLISFLCLTRNHIDRLMIDKFLAMNVVAIDGLSPVIESVKGASLLSFGFS